MRRGAADARPRGAARWLAPFVLCVGLVLTAGLCGWSLRTNEHEAASLLERRADALALTLSSRVQSYVDTLPGLRVFGVLRQSPTDAEFNEYVEAISLQRRYPGLALTFMADAVPQAQRSAYVEAVRRDRSRDPAGHPGFDIRPAGERPAYMVLRHLHPANSVSFGYDLFDPAQQYRAAVDEAVASGGYVATGPLLLAADRFRVGQPQLTNVVIRAATYAGGLTPTTPQARRGAAQGVVGISFRTTDIVRSVLPPEWAHGAQVRIVDRRAARDGQNATVFDTGWLDQAAVAGARLSEPVHRTIEVADRSWDITIAVPVPALAADIATWWALALGSALSASLAVMTHLLVRARATAERQVGQATAALQLEKNLLEQSESRFRMLFTHSMDAVLRTRPSGEILAANPAACALFGRTEQALCALGRERLADTTDPRLAEMLERRSRSGHVQGQFRMFRADGSTFEAEVASSVFTDIDGSQAGSLIVRDVTERQRQAQRQAQLTAILDTTPDFVGLCEPNGRVLFLNRAGRRLLGRSETDPLEALQLTDCHPSWAARLLVEQGIPTAIRDGLWFARTAIRAADGRDVSVSQVLLRHHDELGRTTHLSTIARDLTELDRAAADRQVLEDRLREAQKLESIGTLAGGVAHDFNNVLAAILGNAALVGQDLPPDHPAARHVALIHQAASRARTLVQQILTFSRRGAQARSVQWLRPLVEESLALLRSTLPAGVRLDAECIDEPLVVLVDAAQIQQVVLNLCMNAWQALPDQQGVIRVRLDRAEAAGLAEPAPVDARPARPQRWARLEVHDNGAGMDEATQARVFEPFFTTKPVGQGTGLGLAVVHGIVIASGGQISIRSAPGQGTRVQILLPLVAAELRETPTIGAPSAPVPAAALQELLYVDDDEVVALTVQALLARRGYRVTCLANADDALAAVRRRPRGFALVVSDYNMPGMSGLELARALNAIAPQLPVVITSGYVTEEMRALARQAGVRAVVLKEYVVEELGGLIHDILSCATPAPGTD